VLNDLIFAFSITGVARAFYLTMFLHCTMAKPSLGGHDIVNENLGVNGNFWK
jgi:hypothetical protein